MLFNLFNFRDGEAEKEIDNDEGDENDDGDDDDSSDDEEYVSAEDELPVVCERRKRKTAPLVPFMMKKKK